MSLLLSLGVGGAVKTPGMSHYLFIDGAYLDLAYSNSLIQPFFGVSGDLDIAKLIELFSVARIYYYNAIDDRQRDKEPESDYNTRIAQADQRYAEINSIPNCHVRLGTVTGKRTRKGRQKQVDVQLAVDALLHAFNKNAGTITLLAGDLDFKPLVEALVQLGVDTRVRYERTSSSRDFYSAADQASRITLRDAWSWSTEEFQKAHPLPSYSTVKAGTHGVNNYPPNSIHERQGMWQGREVRLLRDGNTNRYSIYAPPRNSTERGFFAESDDVDLLQRYYEFEHGTIEWQNPVQGAASST